MEGLLESRQNIQSHYATTTRPILFLTRYYQSEPTSARACSSGSPLSSDFGSFNLLTHGDLLDACAKIRGRGEENFSFWDPAGFGMTIGAVTKQEKKNACVGQQSPPRIGRPKSWHPSILFSLRCCTAAWIMHQEARHKRARGLIHIAVPPSPSTFSNLASLMLAILKDRARFKRGQGPIRSKPRPFCKLASAIVG